MDQKIEDALARGGIVDITTTGRRTGRPRRIEIFMHNFDGQMYLTGRPGFKRDWLANLAAHPEFTLHLKRGVNADLSATATVITDPEQRREVIYRARTESWGVDPERAQRDHDHWAQTSPLVSFMLN
ncbi:MAG TPA: nitroreductase/quinone reductase family protein [Acidimicrobiia bacterium]|nr:nitroreductase/quinone reductase family protein [Acidimicrobiia bacterium]